MTIKVTITGTFYNGEKEPQVGDMSMDNWMDARGHNNRRTRHPNYGYSGNLYPYIYDNGRWHKFDITAIVPEQIRHYDSQKQISDKAALLGRLLARLAGQVAVWNNGAYHLEDVDQARAIVTRVNWDPSDTRPLSVGSIVEGTPYWSYGSFSILLPDGSQLIEELASSLGFNIQPGKPHPYQITKVDNQYRSMHMGRPIRLPDATK